MEVEDIKKALKKMKNKKACGIDGIPIKVWKQAGEEVRKGLVELMKQIWLVFNKKGKEKK